MFNKTEYEFLREFKLHIPSDKKIWDLNVTELRAKLDLANSHRHEGILKKNINDLTYLIFLEHWGNTILNYINIDYELYKITPKSNYLKEILDDQNYDMVQKNLVLVEQLSVVIPYFYGWDEISLKKSKVQSQNKEMLLRFNNVIREYDIKLNDLKREYLRKINNIEIRLREMQPIIPIINEIESEEVKIMESDFYDAQWPKLESITSNENHSQEGGYEKLKSTLRIVIPAILFLSFINEYGFMMGFIYGVIPTLIVANIFN